MSTRRTILIPLVSWTEKHRCLLEVIFERHLGVPPVSTFSAVADLEMAGVPFAAESADAANRFLKRRHRNSLNDIRAIVANPMINLVGRKAWLGLTLGMVSALIGHGVPTCIATGEMAEQSGGDGLFAPADHHSLSLKLSVATAWLARRGKTTGQIPMVIPATLEGGASSRIACADILDQAEHLGAVVIAAASMAEAMNRMCDGAEIPSRSEPA